MSAKPDAVLEADAFAEELSQAKLPAVVMPLIGACATPDGHRFWKATQFLPREADATTTLLERKAHPRWRDAVRNAIGLDAISDALARYLANPTLMQALLARDPADFIVASAAEALRGQCLADAWLRGEPDAIARLQRFLSEPGDFH